MDASVNEALLGANEIYLADSVVSEKEQSALVAWANGQHSQNRLFEIPRNPGAFSTPFRTSTGALTRLTNAGGKDLSIGGNDPIWVPHKNDLTRDPMPDEFWAIRQRVIDLLDIGGLQEDDYKGSFLSYIAPGGAIHRHRDARIKVGDGDQVILRCNVLFKRPASGGLPVIEDREIDVPDRGMWAFFPTERFHSATEVVGEPRGLLSFGFLVDPSAFLERRFRLAASIEGSFDLGCDTDARRKVAEGLRKAVRAQGVDLIQASLLELVAISSVGTTPSDAATQLSKTPACLLPVLESLQRAELIESLSSCRSNPGQVLVL